MKNLLKYLPVIFGGVSLVSVVSAQGVKSNDGKTGILKAGFCEGWECNFTHFVAAITDVIHFIITIGLFFSVIVFAWAGWLYMTSGGNEGKRTQANSMMWKALIGFLLVLGAFLIVKLITTTLGLDTSKVKIIF